MRQQKEIGKVDIYFTRLKNYHSRKDYNHFRLFLEKANKLKIRLFPSNINQILSKVEEHENNHSIHKEIDSKRESAKQHIFLVRIPRCGSRHVESILSLNKDVVDLVETFIFEKT
tara:strand:+ start:160 stop:504 length:345 start_codon:yes stop_codon:yes gene_type:complete